MIHITDTDLPSRIFIDTDTDIVLKTYINIDTDIGYQYRYMFYQFWSNFRKGEPQLSDF